LGKLASETVGAELADPAVSKKNRTSELYVQVRLKELKIFQWINPNGAVTAGAQ